jgi:cell fate regulator YaaT (PSP1 superfamily)
MSIPILGSRTLPARQSEVCEYLVSHGKSGAFGRFVADVPMSLERGARVVIRSARGQEIGSVLCPANARHGQYLGESPPGKLLRRTTAEDELVLVQQADLSRSIFDDSQKLARQWNLPIEILDVEILLDGSSAILQFLGQEDADFTQFIDALTIRHRVPVHLENLALPQEHHEETHGGCGKPDCGRLDGGGGCTTCGSDTGGCSSCGGGKVDMKAYFAHLRTKMEERKRTPLL